MNNISEKVKKGIALDKRMKEDKKELDSIKADLQAEALREMENKNLKFVEYFGIDGNGSCAIAYKEKFEVDNLPELTRIAGEVIDDKITKEEKVKITVEDKFKKALIAIYNGKYGKHNISKILKDLNLDDKKINMALKKLKGEYKADKELLERLGINSDIEEELDAIMEQKNYELIEKFFDIENLDIDSLKKSVSVEETLSIGFNYE